VGLLADVEVPIMIRLVEASRRVLFGSFNQFTKLSDRALGSGPILSRVPGLAAPRRRVAAQRFRAARCNDWKGWGSRLIA
jgi:hypothetical protein